MITRVGIRRSESGRSGSGESPTPTLHERAGDGCAGAGIDKVSVEHPAGHASFTATLSPAATAEKDPPNHFTSAFSNCSNFSNFSNFSNTFCFQNNASLPNDSYLFNSAFNNNPSGFSFLNNVFSNDSSTSQFLNCSTLKKRYATPFSFSSFSSVPPHSFCYHSKAPQDAKE